ncbi:MAG TPA: 4a-hydroxytetrahydrobiopterin dehydratase [Fimbriimonas sp.]|nr:4a-hydroxytetrahydrobiopterin dehydratase [Fimbriimonas sp.]
MLERRKLTPEEVTDRLSQVPGWELMGDKVGRTFEFSEYQFGLVFATAVGRIADTMDHHPDILIGYRKVTVSVNTHDVGGISDWDFELARKVSALI